MNSRRRAYRLGHDAENRAVLWLRLKGYRILARRYKTPLGEIDIVARRRGVIGFVEVKARRSLEEARHALKPHQRQRIERAARIWLQNFDKPAYHTKRFDVILIAPWRRPRHIENAFPAHAF
jgi:putative endonuclease